MPLQTAGGGRASTPHPLNSEATGTGQPATARPLEGAQEGKATTARLALGLPREGVLRDSAGRRVADGHLEDAVAHRQAVHLQHRLGGLLFGLVLHVGQALTKTRGTPKPLQKDRESGRRGRLPEERRAAGTLPEDAHRAVRKPKIKPATTQQPALGQGYNGGGEGRGRGLAKRSPRQDSNSDYGFQLMPSVTLLTLSAVKVP